MTKMRYSRVCLGLVGGDGTMTQEPCPALEKIKSPAGDAITVRAYREYVCRMLREELTMDEIRALLAYVHCPIEELVDKILESKMVGMPKGKGR